MSEAGLPGKGVKLGPELFRGPKGIWFSGVAADGSTVGVLRFDQEALAGEGALPALIQRVVVARAGRLPGAPTVVDLVEDDGEVWLITKGTPVRETASKTEELLLAPDAPAVPGMVVPPVRVVEPRGSRIGLVVRLLVGLALSGGIVGAAAVAATKLRSKPHVMALQISGISVDSPGGYTSSSICNVSLPLTAVLQTNGGTGSVTFEWDVPGIAPVKTTRQVTGVSPQTLSLDWQLRLHGKGTVTAKFVIDNAGVLAPGAVATASASMPYQCP